MSLRIVFGFIVLCNVSVAWSATTIERGSQPTVLFRGTLVTPEGIVEGEMVIDGDAITCVAVSCSQPQGATILTITHAFIFPGFVDAHNHTAYNVLQRWTPSREYRNRDEWQREPDYKAYKAPYTMLLKEKGLYCEMVKYGEIKALLSGITTIQGTPLGYRCIRTIIRNAENQSELNVPADHIRTNVLSIRDFHDAVDWTITKAFVVHLAEGKDDSARGEFGVLRDKGLLTSGTAIIHGAALEEPEFREMGRVGAKLIWSPKSNLVLYNHTTDIKQAINQGVKISIGVDWNATGSDTIFDELRVASELNVSEFQEIISSASWIKFITEHPADALALEDHIGRLKPGLKADITVLRAQAPSAEETLLRAHPQDVEMVWVGGELLYGDESIVKALKPEAGCEPLRVSGVRKEVCVKDNKDPVDKSSQTLGDIVRILKAAFPQLAPIAP
jgi:5-methylthioadenosine/S-adenosylhomocysteine deaminase